MLADPGGKFKVTSVFFLSFKHLHFNDRTFYLIYYCLSDASHERCMLVLVALLTLGISHSLSPAHHSVVDIDLMPMQVRPLLLMLHTTTTHALP